MIFRKQEHLAPNEAEPADYVMERPLEGAVTVETQAGVDAIQEQKARRAFLAQVIEQETRRQTRKVTLVAMLPGIAGLLMVTLSSYFGWPTSSLTMRGIITVLVSFVPVYFCGRPTKKAREAMQELAQIEEQPFWKSLFYPTGMDGNSTAQVLHNLHQVEIETWQEANVDTLPREKLDQCIKALRDSENQLVKIVMGPDYLDIYVGEDRIIAALQTVVKAGDQRALPFAKRWASGKGLGKKYERIRQAAQECLPLLKEHTARETLLRASNKVETPAETLLRPVTESSASDPQQLLRPTSGEPKP